jgi:hypothetical protein
MTSFTKLFPRQILLGWSGQKGWGVCGLWHTVERRNTDRKGRADLEDPSVDETTVLKWNLKMKRR